MKKAIFSIILILLCAGTFAQTTITSGMTGKQTRDAINGNFTTSFADIDTLKVRQGYAFNVKEYGAIPDDGINDHAQIQACINAAYAEYNGAAYVGVTIKIPAGVYNIADSIVLKSNVSIDLDKGAKFVTPNNYAGAIWTNDGYLRNCYVTGGTYSSATKTCTPIRLISHSSSQNVVMCRFRDMNLIGCKTGIYLGGSGDGWVNDNMFTDIQIWVMVTGIKFVRTVSSQLDGNLFDKIVFQSTGLTSCYGINELQGSYNQFSNIFFWDFPAAQYTMVLGTGCVKNTFSNVSGINGDFINNSPLGQNLTVSDWTLNLGARAILTTGPYTILTIGKTVSPVTPLPFTDNVDGIPLWAHFRHYMFNNASSIDLGNANPQLQDGTDGTTITIFGYSDTVTLTIRNGKGVKLKGGADIVLRRGDTVTLVYVAALDLWCEV
jgi:hypothetical protein